MTLLDTGLEYSFKDQDLLEVSLTHKSFSKNNNERLEYLGDALLNFVIAEIIYKKFEGLTEGTMTQFRASLVSREVLNSIGKEINLDKHIRIGHGESLVKNSILGNTLEALVGAIYKDGGFDASASCIESLFFSRIEMLEFSSDLKDPKSKLQEYLQKIEADLPVYEIITEHKRNIDKLFTVSCSVASLKIIVKAKGVTKKKAELKAARNMLDKIKKND